MKIVTTIRFLVLVMLTGWAIAACQRPVTQPSNNTRSATSAGSADCRMIQHDLGETEVCSQPQRILVLGPHALEPLLALGIQPIAYADYFEFHQGDYDNPGQQIPYLGRRITQPLLNIGMSSRPSIEAILKSQPDLILGPKESVAKQYDSLSDIAPTLLLSWEDPEQNLRTIAQAVDRPERAEQILNETEQQIAAARETFAPLVDDHPKLLLLRSIQFSEIYLGSNQPGLCSSLVKELGFELLSFPESSSAAADSLRNPISLETLPQLNEADSIIFLGTNVGQVQQFDTIDEFETHQLSTLQQAWEKNEIAQSLDASKARRVYFISTYLCSGLSGPIGTELYLEKLKQQLLTPN